MTITFTNGTSVNQVNRIFEHYDFNEYSDGKIHLEIYLNTGSLSDGLDIFDAITNPFTATNAKGQTLTYSGYSNQSVRSTLNDDGSELVIELSKELEVE